MLHFNGLFSSSEERNIDLKDHPDYREIEYAGQVWPWFLGSRSFKLIRKEDPDRFERVWEALNEPIPTEELTDAQITAELMDRLAHILYAGFKVFDEDLEFEEVETLMTAAEVSHLTEEGGIEEAISTDEETKKKTEEERR